MIIRMHYYCSECCLGNRVINIREICNFLHLYTIHTKVSDATDMRWLHVTCIPPGTDVFVQTCDNKWSGSLH